MHEHDETGAAVGVDSGRRKVLMGTAALAVAATLSGEAAAGMDHAHHHGQGQEALVDAALDCLKKSQACIEHCIGLFKEGDTSLAECMDRVVETEAMCAALARMAASGSSHLPALAAVCRKVCLDCEKECRKHEKHAACKACAESCKACAEECEKVAA